MWYSLYANTSPPAGGGGGLFTSTNPEVRRVSPTANGRTRIKLVYVVLEAQYQSALTQAVKNINSNRSNVCVEIVGYLLEELRDPTNYDAFTKDMEDANVFIGSLIFIEELADKVCCCPTCCCSRLLNLLFCALCFSQTCFKICCPWTSYQISTAWHHCACACTH